MSVMFNPQDPVLRYDEVGGETDQRGERFAAGPRNPYASLRPRDFYADALCDNATTLDAFPTAKQPPTRGRACSRPHRNRPKPVTRRWQTNQNVSAERTRTIGKGMQKRTVRDEGDPWPNTGPDLDVLHCHWL